jgi:hypothetical protein
LRLVVHCRGFLPSLLLNVTEDYRKLGEMANGREYLARA